MGGRFDRADHPRRVPRQRGAGRLRSAHRAAARAEPLPRQGLGAGRCAGAGVLPDREECGPEHAVGAADRSQRPRRDGPPRLQHRRGQRIRSAVRGDLRLLQSDGTGRRYADPRSRRGPDGDQLPAWRPAGAGRPDVLFQAHAARDRAAPPDVCNVHGQTDAGRAGQRDAHPSKPARRENGPQHLQQPGRLGLHPVQPLPGRAAEIHAGRDGAGCTLRQLVSAHRASRCRADQHPVGP